MLKPRRPAPTQCLEDTPSSKTVRLGGRFISITRLCEYGMDHGYLSYVLSGDRVPSVLYGKKIARCLGILKDDGMPDLDGLLQLIEERRAEMEAEHRRRAG